MDPQQPHVAQPDESPTESPADAPIVSPAEPAPGTVLPSEQSGLDERGDEHFQGSPEQGEGGDGGEPYDGGEVPQVDAPMPDENDGSMNDQSDAV